MSQNHYQTIAAELEAKIRHVEYSRIISPLGALLEGTFFHTFIKQGVFIVNAFKFRFS